ncbi:UNVERIFIED_CONTAM: pre-mRNA-splicing factor syf2 [Siphonaria sp. JEL0065]|nr:pre-mRNA-splicing factor syf2 [Siphonaria sp. JEL0065]
MADGEVEVGMSVNSTNRLPPLSVDVDVDGGKGSRRKCDGFEGELLGAEGGKEGEKGFLGSPMTLGKLDKDTKQRPLQQESSLKDNKMDVRKEFERSKRNVKEEIRKLKREAKILDAKLKADEEGVDYERLRAMTYSVESVERYEKKERAKEKRKQIDFTDYAQIAVKKYKSLTKALEPDMAKYQEQKLVGAIADVPAGTAVVTASGSISTTNVKSSAYAAIGNKPSQDSRKAHNPDDDVTYINERNMRFNKKISRAYDKHTAEIKAAFERGAAL